MQAQFLEQLIQRAKGQAQPGQLQRIVLPEGLDPRILTAAAHCTKHALAQPIVLGDAAAIKQLCKAHRIDAALLTIVDPSVAAKRASYAQMLFELRKAKGMTIEQAAALLKQPLMYANCMLRAGDADGCVAGAQHRTAEVVRTALQIIGVATGFKLVSSFFIMALADNSAPLLFADCALNIAPDAAQLADIALSSARSAEQLLNIVPKVAMLSFSTNGSAEHPQVSKVRAATALVKQHNPQLNVIGEVQFDAAFNSETLAKKWPDSGFNAPANVFIFPSLEAGNIGYKIAERIGGALPIGPILQGLKQPVNDLSRGCAVEAIINTIVVTALQSA